MNLTSEQVQQVIEALEWGQEIGKDELAMVKEKYGTTYRQHVIHYYEKQLALIKAALKIMRDKQ